MKKFVLFILIISIFPIIKVSAQYDECFYTPTDTDASGFQYYDYVVRKDMTIEAVYGGFRRPGYGADEKDWTLEYCGNSLIYNKDKTINAWKVNDTMTSLYRHWINVSSFNMTEFGMVRASIPPESFGAYWDSVCFRFPVSSIDNARKIKGQFKFYPLPNQGEFTIEYDANDLVEFSIFDLNGRLIHHDKVTNYNGTFSKEISLGNISKGYYLLQLSTEKGILFKKIIIQ